VEAEKYKVQNELLRSKAESQAETSGIDLDQPDTSLEKVQEQHSLDSVSGSTGDETSHHQERADQNGADPQPDLDTSPSNSQEQTALSIEESTVPFEENALPTTSLDGHSSPALTVLTCASKLHIARKQDDLTPVLVADDSETPTQSNFPPNPSAISCKPSSGLASCVLDANSENKENIPPLGYQQTDGSGSPLTHTPTKASALSENTAASGDSSVQNYAPIEADAQAAQIIVAEDRPASRATHISTDNKDMSVKTASDNEGEKVNVRPEAQTPHQPTFPIRSIKFTPDAMKSIGDQGPQAINESKGEKEVDASAPATASPVRTPKTSEIRPPKTRPSMRGSQIPLASPKSGSNHTPIKPHPGQEDKTENARKTVRKPLQSPIKLSESRPGQLDLDKDGPVARKISHRRRTSTGSVGSLLSDHSSLISSPDAPEPRTASSNETQTGASSHTKPTRPPSHGLHTLREDRLRRFENHKHDPRVSFQQNRTVSLPLERFINERLELGLAGESPADMNGMKSSMKRPITSSDFPKPPKVCKTFIFLVCMSNANH